MQVFLRTLIRDCLHASPKGECSAAVLGEHSVSRSFWQSHTVTMLLAGHSFLLHMCSEICHHSAVLPSDTLLMSAGRAIPLHIGAIRLRGNQLCYQRPLSCDAR